MSGMKEQWERLGPKTRRILVVAATLAGVGTVVGVLSGDPPSRDRKDRETRIENVLTDHDTRTVTLDSMAARIQSLEEEKQRQDGTIARLKQEVEKKTGAEALRQENTQLGMQLTEMQRRLQQLEADTAAAREAAAAMPVNIPTIIAPEGSPRPGDRRSGRDRREAGQLGTDDFYGERGRGAPQPAAQPASVADPGTGEAAGAHPSSAPPTGGPPAAMSAAPEIRVITDDKKPTQDNGTEVKIPPTYIPAASLLSATLITGMDAPTNVGAQKQPFPALARIKKEAVLPNNFTADILDCHVLMEGFGDLSSERAYLRGTLISCMSTDGNVLEAAFPAYAVGEDGKAGVRGRLVSKQGSILAKALVAGTLQGISQAFDAKPVPILNTSGNNQDSSVNVWQGEETIRSAAVGGIGSALDRLANFYIEQASQMYPVIEIDAARAIDLVSSGGIMLQFRRVSPDQAMNRISQQIGGGQGGGQVPGAAGMASALGMGGGVNVSPQSVGGNRHSYTKPLNSEPKT